MPFSQQNGVSVYYETYCEGHPFILIHANPFDHRLWLYQIAKYSQAFRVVALDIRGYGRSDKPETPFTLRDMADDIVAVIRAEKVERAVFLGVSVGANIVLLIGLDHPQMVNGLVMVGGGARMTTGEKRIAGYLSDAASYRGVHIRELVSPAFRASPLGAWLLGLFLTGKPAISGASIAQIFRALIGSDVRSRLHEIVMPTLFVNGELDGALPNSREAAAGIPGAQHVILAGSGHACNLEDPAAFDRTVTPFLLAHGT